MKRTPARLLTAGVLSTMAYAALCACSSTPAAHAQSPQQHEGKFRNVVPREGFGFAKTLSIGWRVLTEKPSTTVPRGAIPVQPLSAAALADAPDGSLYRLGHSTLLLKLNGAFWLTDPVFSERASPFQWMGPRRFHAPPITIDELPPIKGVILSHDHYDHLDHDAIVKPAPKVEVFDTPLGVGDGLIGWGVDRARCASSTGGKRPRCKACTSWQRRPSTSRAVG